MKPPFSEEELAEACKDVVRANAYDDAYVRPLVFLGEAASPLAAPLRVAVIASEDGPLAHGPDDGSTAKISSFQRISSNVIPPAAKASGQYLNSFLAKMEAVACGYDEAIMLNGAGHVTDGWSQNVFVVSNHRLTTPPVSSGALAGITRASLIALAQDLGLAVAEQDLTRTDLYLADECFLAGTAAEVVPIISVDEREVGSGEIGPCTKLLTDAYKNCVHGRTDTHQEWLEYL